MEDLSRPPPNWSILARVSRVPSLSIFISFERSADDELVRELVGHLTVFGEGIKILHRGLILPGSEADREVAAQIAEADVILILVSSYYIASSTCVAEMEQARALHDARDAVVIPILVRPCGFQYVPISRLKSLPINGVPIASWPDRHAAWAEVVQYMAVVMPAGFVANVGGARSGTGDAHARIGVRPLRSTSPPATPNNLPPRRRLAGRKDELDALDQIRLADTETGRVKSIFGLAGVGKSTLVLEYAHRHLREYPGGVWWVDAEGDPVRALVRLAADLRLVGPPQVREAMARAPVAAEGLARAALLALKNLDQPSLLVLDNIDDRSWSKYLPGGEARVIVTTRDRRFAFANNQLLDVLPNPAAGALAEELAGTPTTESELEARGRVLTELGGLPAAVEVAARAVSEWSESWKKYEDLLHEMELLLDDPDLQTDCRPGVLASLDLSISRCAENSEAQRLLDSAAVFAPDAIPLEWAASTAGLDQLDLMKARSILSGLGVLKLDGARTTVSMHRLVHRQVRRRARTERSGSWQATSARAAAFVAMWIARMVDPTQLPEVDAQLSHIDAALEAAMIAGSDINWIIIADRLATYHQYRARYGEALDLFTRALARAKRLTPPKPLQVSAGLLNLGGLLLKLGRASEAREHLSRSLEIAEHELGPSHAKVATRLSSLGTTLLELGEEAYPLLDRALHILLDEHGEEHPSVASVRSNFAAALIQRGELERAYHELTRAVETLEKSLGQHHPKLVTPLMNLAMILLSRDEADRAAAQLLRALAINEQTYGREHPRSVTLRKRMVQMGKLLPEIEVPLPTSLLRRPSPPPSPPSVAELQPVYSNVLSATLQTTSRRVAVPRAPWAIHRLDDHERAIWARLQVFPEDFDERAAAAVVCTSGDIHNLLREFERSCLLDTCPPFPRYRSREAEASQGVRYWIMDWARPFSMDLISPAERSETERRHAKHFLTIAKDLKEHPTQKPTHEPDRSRIPHQFHDSDFDIEFGYEAYNQHEAHTLDAEKKKQRALKLIDIEWPNFRTAQAWAVRSAPGEETAVQVCCELPLALAAILERHRADEVRHWLEQGLAVARQLQLDEVEHHLVEHLGRRGNEG